MKPREVIDLLETTERELETLASAPDVVLRRPYAPGKWNGIQIINHIADADVNLFTRFLKAIGEDGGTVIPFDPDGWAKELRNEERPMWLSINLISAVMAMMKHYLRVLPEATLNRRVMHSVAGEQLAINIAAHIGKHTAHHLGQVRAIVEGREWSKE